MMLETQPTDRERVAVVIVMSLPIRTTADLASPPHQSSLCDSVADRVPSFISLRPSVPMQLQSTAGICPALGALIAVAVISMIVFTVGSIIQLHISFLTFLALVQMPVGHAWVGIELGERLCLPALEAYLGDDHCL
ncbi:MAG TPA: hypothetical protein VM537_26710 [Anaerolineae bacterium]|nr:hypothetical protein [Anaerolineae bacterium]